MKTKEKTKTKAESDRDDALSRIGRAIDDAEAARRAVDAAWVDAWPHLDADDRRNRWEAEARGRLATNRPVFWRGRSAHVGVMPKDYDGSAL